MSSLNGQLPKDELKTNQERQFEYPDNFHPCRYLVRNSFLDCPIVSGVQSGTMRGEKTFRQFLPAVGVCSLNMSQMTAA